MTEWAARGARVRAAAKLNLSLSIVGRRSDGYHELDSVVVPIDWFDEVAVTVEATVAAVLAAPALALHCEPPDAAPAGAENLAVRAAAMFLDRCGLSARLSVVLRKRIPAGAGLGGGSSDAAAVLRCLNAMRSRPVGPDELAAWALALGADVPLFLFGRPARMQGIGDRLEPVEVDAATSFVIAFSGTPLDTRSVYATHDDLLTTDGALHSIRTLTSGHEALRAMQNDLEAAAVCLQPELRRLKERLLALGAAGASMTGSGSAMFGWWQSRDAASAAASQLRAVGVWAQAVGILREPPAVELMAT